MSGTVRQAITHTANGLTGLVQLNDRISVVPRRLDLIAGPTAEFGNARYEQTWFGVSTNKAAQSGLPVYSPGTAVTDIGIHAGLSYHCSAHVVVRILGNVKEIVGVTNSAVVEKRTQSVIGVGVGYHF